MTRLLVIMGSAETTPTMIKPHRAIFERVGNRPAVVLDTPYGFQENADDITSRAIEYFARSVGRDVAVASYRSADLEPLTAETARARVREAGWVFAGPGSPTYTIRVLRDSGIPELLADKLDAGGAVVFSSAAALTVGVATVPVYEIYKAGEPPHWEPGFDLIAHARLRAVVIPHFDNAEGGHHDTRYCYLGERRLVVMERQLPDDVFVLGVDEHTGLVIDLDADRADIVGLGDVTVRTRRGSLTFPAGSALALDEIRAAGRGERALQPVGQPVGQPVESPAGSPTAPPAGGDHGGGDHGGGEGTRSDHPGTAERAAGSGAARPAGGRSPLLDEARRLDAVFVEALATRDAPGATGAILELEQTIEAWRGDNAATDEPDRARGILRSMVVRLGEVAVRGSTDPRELLGPLVQVALGQRARARAARDWAASDEIRDALAGAGIEVRDTPDGQQWELR